MGPAAEILIDVTGVGDVGLSRRERLHRVKRAAPPDCPSGNRWSASIGAKGWADDRLTTALTARPSPVAIRLTW